MNRPFQLAGVFISLLILYTPLGFAQDEEPSTVPEPENVEVPAGQEVEINEDNYRQFMELKDSRGQRNMLPENAFKPGSGAQKLDKLPEESQKHLRNQLREIIVQGDPWQPGDEDTQYPYVPSNAASTNSSLEKQEAEAWGELVGNYHQREAEIYENSARSQAAKANGSSSNNSNNAGPGGEGQESGQQTQGEQGSSADSFSPNAQNDPNATNSEGVSQNAMEFLTGKGGQVAQAGETDNGAGESSQNDGGDGTQTQQGSDQQAQPDNNSADSTTASATAKVESQSTTGASQNALEYLTGTDTNTGTDEGMPLPELPSLTEQVPANMEGTLTIQDLINAQGVRTATGTGSAVPVTDPDKDGGG